MLVSGCCLMGRNRQLLVLRYTSLSLDKCLFMCLFFVLRHFKQCSQFLSAAVIFLTPVARWPVAFNLAKCNQCYLEEDQTPLEATRGFIWKALQMFYLFLELLNGAWIKHRIAKHMPASLGSLWGRTWWGNMSVLVLFLVKIPKWHNQCSTTLPVS